MWHPQQWQPINNQQTVLLSHGPVNATTIPGFNTSRQVDTTRVSNQTKNNPYLSNLKDSRIGSLKSIVQYSRDDYIEEWDMYSHPQTMSNNDEQDVKQTQESVKLSQQSLNQYADVGKTTTHRPQFLARRQGQHIGDIGYGVKTSRVLNPMSTTGYYTSHQHLLLPSEHSVQAEFGHVAQSTFAQPSQHEYLPEAESGYQPSSSISQDEYLEQQRRHQSAAINPTGQSTWTRPPIFLDLPGNAVRYATGSVAYTQRRGANEPVYYTHSTGRHVYDHGQKQGVAPYNNPYKKDTQQRDNLSTQRKMNQQTRANQKATVSAGVSTLQPVQRGKLAKW